MKDVELSREEALSWPLEGDLLNGRPWHTDWGGTDLVTLRHLVERWLPSTVRFHTSGSTGEPQPWEVAPEQMLAEVLALSDVLGPEPIDGVVAFAPPRHRYGAHCSLLLPAVLGCPAWVRPTSTGALPHLRGGRWLVVAIPSTFAILRHRLDWLASAERVQILHSSARLPAAAPDLLSDLATRARPETVQTEIIELLGSTETGAVATRRHPPGGERWHLVPGVDFALDRATAGTERLAVRTPWLARRSRQDEPSDVHRLDDLIDRVGDRRFQLRARLGRIVKVNGRRHDLDDLAHRFEQHLHGREVACVGVADPTVGEHFELYVVAPPQSRTDLDRQIRSAIRTVGLRPRRVRLVSEIVTSATGKIVFGQETTREDHQP